MAKKAKKTTKKEKFIPIPGSAVSDEPVKKFPPKFHSPTVVENDPPAVESDGEEMSEAEVEAMERRSVAKKQAAIAKVEADVDAQEWTLADPVISDDLKGRVWIAVFRCPEGHKTKATNRQASSGVYCWRCREAGLKVTAQIMEQFLQRPVMEDPDIAKRKKAAKGAQ